MVLEHGSPLGLDGQCVGHALMSVSYVFSMIVFYVLVAYAWCLSWLQWCRHVKFDGVDVGCVYHEYRSVMHVSVCMYHVYMHVIHMLIMHTLIWMYFSCMRS